ncbi:hypothetical protein C4F40_14415 [Sphingobacterium sp. Ka21]|uniref:Uncharacterized protein n=1 Tax=Sphingobacterium pedocola TaxID=2082722 RepID=A0ABR9T991_9SPHI|nr:hypothetical protein [Sphingobacterium pedocola]
MFKVYRLFFIVSAYLVLPRWYTSEGSGAVINQLPGSQRIKLTVNNAYLRGYLILFAILCGAQGAR